MTRKRLQRPGTDKSPLINKFNQVLTRHFLTMFITAGIFIFFSSNLCLAEIKKA